MVLAMDAGFALLEIRTVRKKSQVHAPVKVIMNFSISTIAYFSIGYSIAYGINFLQAGIAFVESNNYALVKFFFLLSFTAAIPAIVSGDIAEHAEFNRQLIAIFFLADLIYPFF